MKKQIPKLENLGKLCTAAIVFPLISSLLLYWYNTANSTAILPNASSPQTNLKDIKPITGKVVQPQKSSKP